MRFEAGVQTDIGLRRKINQDSAAALPDLGLFIIADGMGGHQGGEIASSMVVELLPKQVRRSQSSPDWTASQVLEEAIAATNQAIYEKSTIDPNLKGMGTTATALLFQENEVTIGHVGDSRCYYISNSQIWQVTRDHSLVMEKLRAGLITREQAENDGMKNIITRSVGFEPNVRVETYSQSVKEGDLFLLCSDGLSGLVDDDQILAILERCQQVEPDNVGVFIQSALQELIDAANANGGDDNISIVIVRAREN